VRLFIAALIPEEIQSQLSLYIRTLKQAVDGVKWEKSEKLHVTLKFLGDVDQSLVNEISSLLSLNAQNCSPFQVSTTLFGAFPNLRSPKVLYAGLSQNKEMAEFHSLIEDGLLEFGFERENRKFTPHITLGRVKKRIDLQCIPILQKKEFNIREIGLIKSELRPEGSVYTPVEIFKLEK
jgi:2'-5' RNA ligase